jgi:uncharacterized membrane protein YdfJ with MMPL/SSD domain
MFLLAFVAAMGLGYWSWMHARGQPVTPATPAAA